MASGQYPRPEPSAQLESWQRRLADYNRLRHTPCIVEDWRRRLQLDHEARLLEGRFVEAERERCREAAEAAPTQPRELVDWFEGLRATSAQQAQPFYQWLATEASRRDLAWLLMMETAGGDVLEDLLALTQLHLPWRSQLEVARCFWDEMGQGQPYAMRSRIVNTITRELGYEATQPCVLEVVQRSNLMIALASNRHYAYQAIGALGVLELGTAGPARLLSAALKRLGFSLEATAYFDSRSKLSLLRAHSWASDVILPVVAQDGRVARAIAEGALMRLAAESSCIRRYERELRGLVSGTVLVQPRQSATA